MFRLSTRDLGQDRLHLDAWPGASFHSPCHGGSLAHNPDYTIEGFPEFQHVGAYLRGPRGRVPRRKLNVSVRHGRRMALHVCSAHATVMTMDALLQSLEEYVTPEGKNPFRKWLRGLRDARARARIRVRLNRIRLGNFGTAKPVGGGVSELVIPYGPGYRVYFARAGSTVVNANRFGSTCGGIT